MSSLPYLLLLCLSVLACAKRRRPHARRAFQEDELLALEHSERVAEEAACSAPRPQVLHVADHYPGRHYLPHCTVLHRCGRHAGCCGTERLRCVAQKRQKVALRFYAVLLPEDEAQTAERTLQTLTFYNHTQCACVPNTHKDAWT